MSPDRWWQAALACGALAALAAWLALAPPAGWTRATRLGLALACAGLACWAAGAVLRGFKRKRALRSA